MSNYYLYQKDTVEPELKKFSALLDAYGQAQRVRPPAFDQERSQRPEPMNRQQRRAQERELAKCH